ncbi:hypothetical protein [Rhizobium halophilum]|uniref:hypothetical protein n=1 Tax=Rhizobium halophilum TaxID=2846852 RepID=UPI001EFCD65E|nr:hypothetical protein [Rhizobium halophilum]MCF6370666.1 hypothetical protein [Rhizobium halophilum]
MYKKLLAVSALSLGLATGAIAQTSGGSIGTGSGTSVSGSSTSGDTVNNRTDGDDCQSRGEDKTAMNDTASVAGQANTTGETVVADCED